jgi:hypothetical protein
VALSRLFGGWLAVALWLLLWEVVASRFGGARETGLARRGRDCLVEAGLVTLFGALWFASLGSGAWWLVFALVGALREWPLRSAPGVALLRVVRTLVAGGLLAWRLGPA